VRGKVTTRLPSPRAAAMNQTRVPDNMPATAARTVYGPPAMPVAMENRLAGPGVAAMTAILPRKLDRRDGSSNRVNSRGSGSKQNGRKVIPAPVGLSIRVCAPKG
jgi:hypothetical protein